ncbi:ABC transporter permease [Rubellimicrobium arenae]|uniref:ABC transporter permease n=1 Tax=Rubellimicrobium arenae TaxID=2817372 RepID=UPI001B311597|nr:ABC transporter permease [Rubellimicrobium arenae]
MTTTAGKGRASARLWTSVPWRALAPVVVLAALCIALGLAADNFATAGNFARIATSAAVPAVLATGVTLVILMGGIDLSVEGAMAVAAVVAALVLVAAPGALGAVAAAFAALAAGAALGAVSGAIHVGLRAPSFMVTLGTWFIGLGLAVWLVGGGTVSVRDSELRVLALVRLGGLPLSVWVALGTVLIAWVLQSRTRLGRALFAVGGGEDLAAQSGVPVGRVKVAAFALAGLCYGLGAVLAVAQLGQGNAEIGTGRLFAAVSAAVVGGTSLLGGHGGVLHSLVGVLVVVVLSNGMILLGVPPYLQQAVQGLLIIIAVAVSLDRRGQGLVK